MSKVVLGWIVVGVGLAVAGVLARAPLIAPIYIVGSVVAAMLTLRAWIDRVPIRSLVLLHAIRLPIGAAFLWEYAHERLPASFALKGGVGDMIVGALALVPFASRRAVLAFSLVGLADIVMVALTAQYLVLVVHDPQMLAGFGMWQYALLPFVIVPLVIASHLAAIKRCIDNNLAPV
ncbi:MAG TPA: hypothetical protein VL463_13765 [Kofleriaceae bacterium]|jgi:hypothetical protein|nr:hypothetical protein [Kofleriaceae bacterium]